MWSQYVLFPQQSGKMEIPSITFEGVIAQQVASDILYFVRKLNIAKIQETRILALIGKGYVAGQKVILAKPQTFMNLSGESIREIVDYYKVDDTTELIVISDDISLDVGQLRIRKKGSAGGHNGLKNIIKMLGHDTFIRVRMGVGEKPKNYDLADYVLGHFSAEERTVMDEATKTAAEAIRMIITESADAAMNHFNSKKA